MATKGGGGIAVWQACARDHPPRTAASDGRDLNELLVEAGLAHTYGRRTPLPDGRDSRTYLARLAGLEATAWRAQKGARRFAQ